MKVADAIAIFRECRDRCVAMQRFHDATIWRALMERLEDFNELEPSEARRHTELLAMALRDASDILLKCAGVPPNSSGVVPTGQ